MIQKDYFIRELEYFMVFIKKLVSKDEKSIEAAEQELLHVDFDNNVLFFITNNEVVKDIDCLDKLDSQIVREMLNYFLLIVEKNEVIKNKIAILYDIYKNKSNVFDLNLDNQVLYLVKKCSKAYEIQ